MLAVLIFLLLAFLFFLAVGYRFSAPRYNGPVSDHFNGKTFINPQGIKPKGLTDVLRWMLTRKPAKWKPLDDYHDQPRMDKAVSNGLRVTFVNHSTFLIQTDHVNILTDPVWSERVSPLSWLGPRRTRKPGLALTDLPKIDLILLSHNHYDHLDIATLKILYRRFKPIVYVPLGVSAFLHKHGITQTTELDWWNEKIFNETLSIQSVPAQHFSGRGMFDRDATLWCGFVLKKPEGNIYYAGDTGYNPVTFKEIGRRCSPVSLAFIPIGAYKPDWFMSPVHCSPEEAVTIHQEVGATQSIAMHFGTFPLADEDRDDPANDLHKALVKQQLELSRFLVPQEGVALEFHLQG
jgi:L-ascorbate metabolism protein UlaG (beta-lactamase superfamily)